MCEKKNSAEQLNTQLNDLAIIPRANVNTECPQFIKELTALYTGGYFLDLDAVPSIVKRYKDTLIPIVAPKSYSYKSYNMRVCGQDGTEYSGDEEQLKDWKDCFLPERMEMVVIGAIDHFPFEADNLMLVLLLCEDGKIYGYDNEVLHLVARNVKELHETGLDYLGFESYKPDDVYYTEEEYEKIMEPKEMKEIQDGYKIDQPLDLYWLEYIKAFQNHRLYNKLTDEQTKAGKMISMKRRKMMDLEQAVDTIKSRSQEAVEDSERIFTELISFMEKKRSEVMEMIRAQEKTELSLAERLINKLYQEIADLKRRATEVWHLKHKHDHISLQQSFKCLCVSPGFDDSPSFTVNQQLSFDGVRKSLSDLKKQLEEMCEEKFLQIRPEVAAVHMILYSEPERREDLLQSAAVQMILLSEPESREYLLQYFCSLTLDPNTAHQRLTLSEDNRAVTFSNTEQRYSDHPERFDCWRQVLCKESVCGRCYWEVERTGGVTISVSYNDISRKGWGDECRLGYNSQSWSLWSFSYNEGFQHNNISTSLRVPAFTRIGVYVDHSAGILSFYNVSDTLTLLHRVHTTFTEPLYAGFCLWSYDASVRIL